MFLGALPLSYTGSVLGGCCSKCHDALVRNDDNTGNPFRSSDLGVMSPARFLCAMPVKMVFILFIGFFCFVLFYTGFKKARE